MARVLIGTPFKDMAHVDYTECLANMIAYSTKHGHDITFIKALGGLYDARERLCQKAIAGKYDYLLFIDSDQTFEPDSLCRLLDRSVDVVTGVYVGKEAQHRPVLFTRLFKNGDEQGASSSKEGLRELLSGEDFFQLPNGGGCGAGFLLISIHVLIMMRIHKHNWFMSYDGLGEDVSFCARCGELGFPIWVDKSLRIGHMKSIEYSLKDWNGSEEEWIKDDKTTA